MPDSRSTNVKQVIIVRKDLKMSKGKLAAQAAHASVDAFLYLFSKSRDESSTTYSLNVHDKSMLTYWLGGTFAKIALSVSSEQELLDLYNKVHSARPDLPIALIEDAGLTEFHGIPTKTCLAIGPYFAKDIDTFTSNLKLL